MSVRAGAIIVGALLTRMVCPAAGEEFARPPDDPEAIMAATRIFALQNHLRGDITVDDKMVGHIGDSFDVANWNLPCIYVMRHRDGVAIEAIDLRDLSGEYRVSHSGSSVHLTMPGRGRAECEIDNDRFTSCSTDLDMLLTDDGTPNSELSMAQKALAYLLDHVCRPIPR